MCFAERRKAHNSMGLCSYHCSEDIWYILFCATLRETVETLFIHQFLKYKLQKDTKVCSKTRSQGRFEPIPAPETKISQN